MNIITMIVQIILVAIIVSIKAKAHLHKIKLTYDSQYNQYEGYEKERFLLSVGVILLNIFIFIVICTVIYLVESIAILYLYTK